MRVETRLRIEAPPPVVFRFYTRLDHLRFVCPAHRHEWAVERGVELAVGREADVRIQQRGRAVTVRFRTVRLEPDRSFEDVFVSWPVRGATHRVALTPLDTGRATDLHDVIAWEPPWYVRALLERHEPEQRRFFAERQANAKRLIEAVYAVTGDGAFARGIDEEAMRVGLAPVVDGAR